VAFRKGGDGNWNKFLNSYGVEPMSPKDREFLLNSEMKIARAHFLLS
jgi:hypothetical protein